MRTLVLISAVLIYLLLCYYIGRKIKNVFVNNNMRFSKWVHWPIYWFIALSFIISSMFKMAFGVNNIITLIGIIFISMFIYSILLFLIIDIIRFIFRRIKINTKVKLALKKIYCNGLSVFIVVIIVVLGGFLNVQNKHITNYEVNINKSAGNIKNLNVVMVSDLHLGIEVREEKIDKMVESINKLNPDLVVFCGDMYDESTYQSLKEYSSEKFKTIKSKYGVYGILGNHEYYSGDINETISYLKKGNIKILKDEAVKIDNSFYIVGRDDQAVEQSSKTARKPLDKILNDTDKTLPILLLDHRPDTLNESIKDGVDLQMSGHTHKGQIFPGSIVTGLLNEKDYGQLKKNNFNLIVSSGYGTWAFPIRVGSICELVNIKVNFK